MSFPRYPKYKASGVEWLGEVPQHWIVKPIRLAAKLESGHTPSRSHPEYWENCTVPWITLSDVWQIREGNTKYIYETKEKVSELGLANSSARLLPKNTVILSRTASVGFSAIMGLDMATTQDFANWICGPLVLPEFLLNVFRSMHGEFRRLMMRVIGGNGLMGYTDQGNIEHSVLVVGRVGALCGNIHVVNPPAWITDNALILDPDYKVFDLQFLSSVLRIRNLNDIASKTAQPLITGTQLSDQRIPAPPSHEQREITAYLDHETAKLDALTAEAERGIELLQERRTALISAAVTGQIDVRGLAETEDV